MQQALYAEACKCQIDGTVYDFEAGKSYPLDAVTQDHVARGVATLIDMPEADPAPEAAA